MILGRRLVRAFDELHLGGVCLALCERLHDYRRAEGQVTKYWIHRKICYARANIGHIFSPVKSLPSRPRILDS